MPICPKLALANAVPLHTARADRRRERERRKAEADVQTEEGGRQRQRAGRDSGDDAETLDGSQSDAPVRRLDASAGDVGSSEQRVPTASAGSSRIVEDASDGGVQTDEESQTESEYSERQRETACKAIVRKVGGRIQKAIIQKCVQEETEEVRSVFRVVRAFGTKRGKVTRKEVFAAAKALEDEGLVIVRGDVVSWRDVCKRRKGHE